MKFGLLKSKIEKKIIDSYAKNNFKNEIKLFKKYVLENKSFSKIFYIYDNLSENKGFDKDYVNDYINECVDLYNKITRKINKEDCRQLNEWVSNIETENNYLDIDNIFSNNVLMTEEKLKSRKKIIDNIVKTPKQKGETMNLPISTLFSVANKSANSYIESLDESERIEIIKIMNESDDSLQKDFETLKINVIEKLENIKESDEDSKSRIAEAIEKIKTDSYSKFSYYNLKNLYESI
jgi:hypothetical protein